MINNIKIKYIMSLPENFICPITQAIMENPVMCEDGISYERDAITRWLQNNSTSPVTRQPISKNFILNIALRNTIQDYQKISNTQKNSNTQKISNIQKNSNPVITNFYSKQNSCYYDGNYYSMLTLTFTNTCKKNNIIIAIVDTSGSMGENADIPGTESSGLSRLDLVKHTLNTITQSLSDNDRLCIIKFSNSANIVSDFIKLDVNGKSIVQDNIKSLQPEGMTNLWAGIKLGIDKIASIYDDKYNISMIVMTDGVSNSDPPRGIIPTLQEQIRDKNLNFSINTFGYGYNIDSNLLQQIAFIGNGIFGFIPDATMVGTIFINMIAFIINGSINNLEIFNIDGFEMLTPLNYGMISANQPIHIIFKGSSLLNENIKIRFNQTNYNIMFNTNTTEITKLDFEQLMRIELIKIITKVLVTQNGSELLNFQSNLIRENKKYNSDYITSIIDDIAFNDPNKGQLTKAVAKTEWFQQWGNHYLKAICRAHQLERCITFKELSPQYYMSDEFKIEQTRIEKIFCDLPAPKSSAYNKQNISTSTSTSTSISMSTFYVQDGGCFDGESMVSMYDVTSGSIYYKPVSCIVQNDIVFCPLNKTNYARVVCILKLKVNKNILMCDIGGMKITPYHPINIENKWIFPIDQTLPQEYNIDYMYDFILDSGHVVKINNIDVITLGHNFTFNNVVYHEYFGDKIIEDLRKHESWDNGYIVLNNYHFVRDEYMRIKKIEY